MKDQNYDVRKDWFMQQNFSEEELEQLYLWEQEKGRVAKIKFNKEESCIAYHILDTGEKNDLVMMKGDDAEEQVRRWLKRMSYVCEDGKVSEWEEEHK